MNIKLFNRLVLILTIVCSLFFSIPASAVSQGTDGSELQVLRPEKLEIHLGESWAGVEFELHTDAGKYPGTISVGKDGVLRLEIGGSSSYVLSCLYTTVDNPSAYTTPPTEMEILPSINNNGASFGKEAVPAEHIRGGTAFSNPMVFFVLITSSLILSAVVLIIRKRRRYDENDEF